MYDAVNDPLFKPSLEAFFSEMREDHIEQLLSAVKRLERDTMREARLAGKVEAYENAFRELEHFAKEKLQSASQ